MRRLVLVLVALAVWSTTLVMFAAPAGAVPSYARRYGVTCSACHTMWGALNGNGVTFRLSGYRAINGRDLQPTQKDVELAAGALAIPTTLPASIVAGVGYDYRSESRRAFDNTSTTRTGSSLDLEDVSIFVSSPIGHHLSVFSEFPMYETRAAEFTPTGPAEANDTGTRGDIQFTSENPVFEVAKFWWNSLLPATMAPRDSLNALFGITQLPLGYASGKVRLSVNQYLVYERRGLDLISPQPISGNALLSSDEQDSLFRLSEPQVMFELNGMLVPFGKVTDLGKPETFWIEYHTGVTNGSNSKPDANTEKDLYARLVGRWYGQSLGGFAFWSPDTYSDNLRRDFSTVGGGIMSGRQLNNSEVRVGPDLTLSLLPFGFPLWLENNVLYNRDSDPTGFKRAFAWWGGFSQLNWQPLKALITYARYDWIRGGRFDDLSRGGVTKADPREWDAVAGVQYLVLENLKLVTEYRRRQFENEVSAPKHAKLDENFFTFRASIGF